MDLQSGDVGINYQSIIHTETTHTRYNDIIYPSH